MHTKSELKDISKTRSKDKNDKEYFEKTILNLQK